MPSDRSARDAAARLPVGWSLTLAICLVLLLLNAALLVAGGWNEESVRVVVRSTARSSVVLFSLAFAASALRRVWSGAASAWPLRNRRYLGVAFAFSHALHALSLHALARVAPPFVETLETVTLVGGGLAYGFIAAMALTSNDAAVAWLGPRRWRLLHRVGGWYVWVIFAQSYGGRVAMGQLAYLPLLALLLVVLGLRVWVWLRGRAPAAASAGAGAGHAG